MRFLYFKYSFKLVSSKSLNQKVIVSDTPVTSQVRLSKKKSKVLSEQENPADNNKRIFLKVAGLTGLRTYCILCTPQERKGIRGRKYSDLKCGRS